MQKSKLQITGLLLTFFLVLSSSPLLLPIQTIKANGNVPTPPSPVYGQIRYFPDWFAVQPVFFYDRYTNTTDLGEITVETPYGNLQYSGGWYTSAHKYGTMQINYIQSEPRVVNDEIVGQFETEDGKQLFIKSFTVEWDQCLYTLADGLSFFDAVRHDKTEELCTHSTNGLFYSSSYITFPDYWLANISNYDSRITYFDQVSADSLVNGLLFTRLYATSVGWADLFHNVKVKTGEYSYQNETWIAIRGTIVKERSEGMVEAGLNTIINTLKTSYNQDPVTGQYSYTSGRSMTPGGKQEDSNNGGVITAAYGYYMGPLNGSEYQQRGMYVLQDGVNTLLPSWEDFLNYNDTKTDVTYWGAKEFSSDILDYQLSSVIVANNYVMRPQTRIYTTTHLYHYEAALDWFTDVLPPYGVWYWDPYISGVWTKENRGTKTISGWEVKNVYALQTMQTQVMVGAYYNWTPYSGIGGGLEPPNATTTDNIFDAIPSGAYEALQQQANPGAQQGLTTETLIFIFIGIVVAVIVIYLIYRKFRKRGLTTPG
jgi:hypothetical protein